MRTLLQIAGLLAVIGAGPGIAAARCQNPDESTAEAVLRAAKLTRLGHSYLLEGEREAAQLSQTIERLQQQVNQQHHRLAELKRNLGQDDRKAAAWRSQADQLRREADRIRKTQPERAKKLDREAHGLDEKARRESKADSQDKAQQQAVSALIRSLDDDREALQKAQRRYNEVVEQTRSAYERLSRRPEIRDALRRLNAGRSDKVALGPLSDYSQNVVRQCVEHLEDLGVTRQGSLYYAKGDDEVVRLASATYREFSERTKLGKPIDDLEKTVRELRERITALEATRQTLSEDPLIRDLIAEVGQQTKTSTRFGTTTAFQRSVREVEQMETRLPRR